VNPRRVLFVCTGNICRSAMAEAIASTMHRDSGVSFSSAGLLAGEGERATSTAVAVCAEVGVDAEAHRSRRLDRRMAESADRIYVMTAEHLERVLAMAPEAAHKTEMLHPDGTDIEDPYGQPASVYRACFAEIAAALEARRPLSNLRTLLHRASRDVITAAVEERSKDW